MVAGREATPRDVANTERLDEYWTEGEGAAKIGWGTPGDYNRCVVELGKHMPPGEVHGHCANLHHRATGEWPATHAKQVRELTGSESSHQVDAAIRRSAGH